MGIPLNAPNSTEHPLLSTEHTLPLNMKSITKPTKEIADLNPAEIEAEMKAIAERGVALETAAKERQEKTAKALNAVVLTFPQQLGKVLGREVSMADCANMVRAANAGKLSFNSTADTADRGKRLTDEQKASIKAAFLARALAVRDGKTPEQVSLIAARHDVIVNTAHKYRPTADEIAAYLAAHPAPAVQAAVAV